MATPRQERLREHLREMAANFFNRESTSPRSLITVTDATVSPDFKRATIYITTIPTSEEERALDFAKRKRSDLRDFIAKTSKLRILPVLEIKLDLGERNRQKIDGLSLTS
ncbi:MAG: ribosome-binding factor A [Candidatus Pacebacteria bacterium]|nr:ribosome-binding factor A [Candidatus Paceibacterota bacterium]